MNRSVICAIFLVLFFPAMGIAEWHKHQFPVMGTEAQIELWEPNAKKAENLIKAVEAEMERINQSMSPWIETSELYQVNLLAAKQPVRVSPEFIKILDQSLYYSNLTDGAFDITYASVGYLYDFRNSIAPDDNAIALNKQFIDFRAIKIDHQNSSVKFSKAGTRIDLGGIAKGYAVDLCIELLIKHGISSAFVKSGGDTRILGDRQGRLWTIGIQHPRQKDQVLTQVPVENVAVSTSGDYERFFIREGERVHHIIDPKSGRSADKSISVSIIAKDALTSDALSTSVFVLGPEEGLALVNRLEDISAIIIDASGKFHYSDDLKAQ